MAFVKSAQPPKIFIEHEISGKDLHVAILSDFF